MAKDILEDRRSVSQQPDFKMITRIGLAVPEAQRSRLSGAITNLRSVAGIITEIYMKLSHDRLPTMRQLNLEIRQDRNFEWNSGKKYCLVRRDSTAILNDRYLSIELFPENFCAYWPAAVTLYEWWVAVNDLVANIGGKAKNESYSVLSIINRDGKVVKKQIKNIADESELEDSGDNFYRLDTPFEVTFAYKCPPLDFSKDPEITILAEHNIGPSQIVHLYEETAATIIPKEVLTEELEGIFNDFRDR